MDGADESIHLVWSFACIMLKSRMSLGSRRLRQTTHCLMVGLVVLVLPVLVDVRTVCRVCRSISSWVNLRICTAKGCCSTGGVSVGEVCRLHVCVLEGCAIFLLETGVLA